MTRESRQDLSDKPTARIRGRMGADADRPEYVTCIRKPRDGSVWCDRPASWSFTFGGLDHAAAAVEVGDRLVPCPECVAAAFRVLQSEQPEP